MRFSRHLLSSALILVTASTLAVESHAHQYRTFLGSPVTWASNHPDMFVSAISFPLTSSFRDALDDSFESWDLGPANVEWDLLFDAPVVSIINLRNEAWFAAPEALVLSGGDAVCVNWNYGFNMAEADVIFSAKASLWTTSSSKTQQLGYGGTFRPFQSTAIHEIGHALGLQHENGTYNMMGEDFTHMNANGSTARPNPGEDSTHGLVNMYGLVTPHREDVGVVHWKFDRADGEYSRHRRTEIFTLSGDVADRFTDRQFNSNGEPGHRVDKGQTILLELTLENNGATPQFPRLEFYLSTNDTISTFDDFLNDRHPTLNPNTVYVIEQEITIPTDLTSGDTLYLGAVIDPDDDIDEYDETNNETYIAIRIN